MVPYNHNAQPTAPNIAQWVTIGNMNAAILLDQAPNTVYTNLDQISGKVVVRSTKSADVSSILVKLEGESRSRLLSPRGPDGEKPKPKVEYHKILYKVAMVFPPSEVIESRNGIGMSKPAYTLPAGQHEYSFTFKLPFNNSCSDSQNHVSVMQGFEGAKPTSNHVKKTLPPTLAGMPGEAEIRYFVKVTVNRASIFKENPRAFASFNFFPIEPPRAPLSGAELFARQKHQFDAFSVDGEKPRNGMKGLFKRSNNSSIPAGTPMAPHVSVDVRLPEPAILTCNQDIPLRLIVKKLNASEDQIYFQALSITLVANTKIRAHNLFRTETESTVIMSRNNLGLALGLPTDPIDTETVLDDRLWRGQALPNVVAPSFETCNISRSYYLDIRVGLSYHNTSQSASKPQNIVLPLRIDTLVYSGIAPPPEVLQRMADSKARINRVVRKQPSKLQVDPGVRKTSAEGGVPGEFGANQIPPSPVDEDGLLPHTPRVGQFTSSTNGAAGPASAGPGYDDAPPSYEDAVATDLPPVHGQRPQYAPPAAGNDTILNQDEKRGWMN